MFEKTYVTVGENAGGFWAPEKLIPIPGTITAIPRPLIAEELEAKERLENVMNYYKLGESTRYRLLKGMVENIERKRKDEQEISLLPYRVERIEEDMKEIYLWYLAAVDGVIWVLNSIARRPALWVCGSAAVLLAAYLIYKVGFADGMVSRL